MKIEKLNENQIRCTLTKEDLESRGIDLRELAYGTDKARSLFREMMRFASYKFGFDTEDVPLMIEAVPISSDKIVLIMTKVPYPDELDARFSDFSEGDEAYDDDYLEENDSIIPENYGSAREILEIFDEASNIRDKFSNIVSSGALPDEVTEAGEALLADPGFPNLGQKRISKAYEFTDIDTLMTVARIIDPHYEGPDHLYLADTGEYILIIQIGDNSPEAFNRVCNIISEYGYPKEIYSGTISFVKEHCRPIILDNAIRSLAAV